MSTRIACRMPVLLDLDQCAWNREMPTICASIQEVTMSRLFLAIFIMAFATITGAIVVALLTLNMSEPVHFYGALGGGAIIAIIVSMIVTKQIKA